MFSRAPTGPCALNQTRRREHRRLSAPTRLKIFFLLATPVIVLGCGSRIEHSATGSLQSADLATAGADLRSAVPSAACGRQDAGALGTCEAGSRATTWLDGFRPLTQDTAVDDGVFQGTARLEGEAFGVAMVAVVRARTVSLHAAIPGVLPASGLQLPLDEPATHRLHPWGQATSPPDVRQLTSTWSNAHYAVENDTGALRIDLQQTFSATPAQPRIWQMVLTPSRNIDPAVAFAGIVGDHELDGQDSVGEVQLQGFAAPRIGAIRDLARSIFQQMSVYDVIGWHDPAQARKKPTLVGAQDLFGRESEHYADEVAEGEFRKLLGALKFSSVFYYDQRDNQGVVPFHQLITEFFWEGEYAHIARRKLSSPEQTRFIPCLENSTFLEGLPGIKPDAVYAGLASAVDCKNLQNLAWDGQSLADRCESLLLTWGVSTKLPNGIAPPPNCISANAGLDHCDYVLRPEHDVRDSRWPDRPPWAALNAGIYACPIDNVIDLTATGGPEAILCYNPAAHTEHELLTSTTLGASTSPSTGESLCRDGTAQMAFPGLHSSNLDDGEYGQRLKACLADLAYTPEEDSPIQPHNLRESLTNLFPAGRCFSPGHFYLALDASLDDTSPRGPRLTMGLLSQWIDLHGFIATDYLSQTARIAALANSHGANLDRLRISGLPSEAEVVDLVLSSWNLVLSQKVINQIAQADPGSLRHPDARPDAMQSEKNAMDPQQQGLAVAVLQGLTRTHDLVTHLLDTTIVNTTGQQQLASQLHAWGQLGATLKAVVADLSVRAGGKDAPWHANLISMAQKEAEAQRRVQESWLQRQEIATGTRTGHGPIPLYFGDVVGTASRFFAASNYLLQGFSDAAVTHLQDVILPRIRDRVAATTQHANHEALTAEAIDERYNSAVEELCGLSANSAASALDRFDSQKETTGTCHVRPECRKGTQLASTELPDTCFRGLVGEATLATRAAAQDVDLAARHAANLVERYDTKVAYCMSMDKDLQEDSDLAQRHANDMREKRVMKLVSDDVAAVARGVRSACNVVDGVLTLGVSSGAAMVASGAEVASLHLEHEMRNRESGFSLTMGRRLNSRQAEACFHEAELMHVGHDTAMLQVSRRNTDMNASTLRLVQARQKLENVVFEGLAARTRQATRPKLSRMQGDWLNADIVQLQKEFAWAKQTTHLTAQALEYELQQPLELTPGLLTARFPQELADATHAIRRAQASRQINGRRPEPRRVLVHLKDWLPSQVHGGADGQQPQKSVSVGAYLASEAARTYDAHGAYVGQGLRFSVAPSEHKECAERLWHTTATVQGNFGLWGQSSVRGSIVKNGVFHSRWCHGLGDGSPYQVGSIPYTNLFKPSQRSEAGTPKTFPGHTLINLDMRTNVPMTRLSEAAYAEGASEGLSGQGLFGEYTFMVNENDLAALRRADDVIVRFDYHSVPN